MSGPRCGKGDGIGAHHGFPPAPERDGLRGVAEHHRHEAFGGKTFRVRPCLAEVVRVMDAGCGDTKLPRHSWQVLTSEIDGGVGESRPRVDADQCRRDLLQRRLRMPVDLAAPCLRSVAWYA